MALVFGAATSDRCDIGSAAALDDMTTGTAWLWTRITTLTTPRCFFGKNAQLACNIANPSALNIRFIRATSGTNIIYTTSDNPLATNQWLFIAASWDFNASSGRAKIYTGTLTDLATERTYGTAQDGSGTLQSDAAAPFHWGNSGVAPTPALALPGSIARCGLANRVLTLEEIRQLQRGPRPVAGLLGAWELGFDGTGTQLDRGGGGFNGTVTGATLGDHVPLRRWRRGGSRVSYATATTYSVTLSGSLTPAGSVVRRTTKLLAGAATPSGALASLKVIIRAMSGALTPAGALVRQVTKRLTAGATPAGALLKATAKSFAGSVTPTGTLTSLKVIIRTMGGSLTPTGGIVRLATKALGGALTPAATLVRQARRAFAGALTPAGALRKTATRRLAGALTPVGALLTTVISVGSIVLMRLVAGRVVRPLVSAGARVVARFRGTPDVGPEA